MDVSLADAVALLPDLVRRAEAGEEIVLTEHGRPVVKLVKVKKNWADMTPEERVVMLKGIGEEGRRKAIANPSIQRHDDYIHDDSGVPA